MRHVDPETKKEKLALSDEFSLPRLLGLLHQKCGASSADLPSGGSPALLEAPKAAVPSEETEAPPRTDGTGGPLGEAQDARRRYGRRGGDPDRQPQATTEHGGARGPASRFCRAPPKQHCWLNSALMLPTSAQIRQAVQALKLSPEARILEQVRRLFGQLDRAEEPVKPTELRRLVRLGWKAQRGEAQQDVSEFFTRCEWRTDERGLPVAASCERNSIGRARCSTSSSERLPLLQLQRPVDHQ